jgi:hypothetical protein
MAPEEFAFHLLLLRRTGVMGSITSSAFTVEEFYRFWFNLVYTRQKKDSHDESLVIMLSRVLCEGGGRISLIHPFHSQFRQEHEVCESLTAIGFRIAEELRILDNDMAELGVHI